MTWLRWVPSSKVQLQQAEQRVLTCRNAFFRMFDRATKVTTKPYEIIDVDVGAVGDVDHCKIHTIKVKSSQDPPEGHPLVLIHGFGCGSAIFAPNFDALSEKRDVYAIDMPGFGLSSRPSLSKDALEAEHQMVDSIETWRQCMQLDRFILLGHSLGGFISSAYALGFSNRVSHLLLEDPWGFPEFDPTRKSRVPLWGRAIIQTLQHMNALAAIRAAGPYGFSMMKRVLGQRHYYMSGYFPEMPDTIPEYLYHCNVRRPTGEEFFRTISHRFGWTRNPMVARIVDLPRSIPLTLLYGERSFITRSPGQTILEKFGEDLVTIYVFENCGHTIHLEKPHEFNNVVNDQIHRRESLNKTTL